MHHLRSRIHSALADAQAQLADLDAAAQIEPDNPEVYNWRQQYFRDRQQYDRVVADLGKIIDLNDAWDAHLERSEAYLLMGDLQKAADDAEHATRQAPEQPQGYVALAHVLLIQKNYRAALDQLDQAVAVSDQATRPTMLALRGRAYTQAGQLDKAEADLTAALALEDANQWIRLGLAELALARQDSERALNYLEQWVNVAYDYGSGFVLRAQTEAARGQSAAARADLAEARKRALFPDERLAADALDKQLGAGP
jgi:tetratricopeptide (TPR) repeat protein